MTDAEKERTQIALWLRNTMNESSLADDVEQQKHWEDKT
jgi:hypothetical protein